MIGALAVTTYGSLNVSGCLSANRHQIDTRSTLASSLAMEDSAVPSSNCDSVVETINATTSNIRRRTMKKTVSIELDRESLARFERLLGSHSLVTGAHCGDDDGVDGVFGGAVASGAHCGDDDGVDG